MSARLYTAARTPTLSSAAALCRAGAVEHPSDAELVDQDTEVAAPEHRLQWHVGLAALSERREQLVGLRPRIGLEVDRDRVPLGEREAHRLGSVGAHQHVTGQDRELDVHDEVPVRVGKWRLAGLLRDVAEA